MIQAADPGSPRRPRAHDVRRPTREWLWSAVYRSGLFHAVRFHHRKHLLVLTYHGVLQYAGTSYLNRNGVSTDAFSRQVEFLRSHYRLLSLREGVDALAGRIPMPEYAALLTFDDGFRNNYRLALPILRAHGIPAAVFVTTGMLDHPGRIPWVEQVSLLIVEGNGTRLDLSDGGAEFHFPLETRPERIAACEVVRRHLKRAPTVIRDRLLGSIQQQCGHGDLRPEGDRFEFLSWDEARTLAGAGVGIGSHTVDHCCLAPLEPRELREQIEGSKRRIEEALGQPCFAFAYPDGTPDSFTDRDERALCDAGYEAAFTQIPGYNRPGCDPYRLRRFNVPGGASPFSLFIATITGARAALKRLAGRG